MAHFVYALVAAKKVADQIQTDWPELERFDAGDAHSIFPVEQEQIEKRVGSSSDDSNEQTGGFYYLSNNFKKELRELSKYGKICYLETEYFGGEGGQCACVYDNRTEIMAPTWAESDTINTALKILGVAPKENLDAFDTIGLGAVRKNTDFSKNVR